MSAPGGSLPGVVAVELLVARNERAAVAVTKLGAYPVGFEFDLLVLVREEDYEELDPMLHGPIHRPGRRRGEAAREMLRFGVEFADGARVTNTIGREHWQWDEPPAAPVLRTGGGHSGGGEWNARMWVWPLPPPGPLAFVCEWPAAGIELARVEIDAQLVIDAAGRAQEIFALPGSSGGNSVSIRSLGTED